MSGAEVRLTEPVGDAWSAESISQVAPLQNETATPKEKSFHPAANGVRQKESGKKVTKKVTKASEKSTETRPK